MAQTPDPIEAYLAGRSSIYDDEEWDETPREHEMRKRFGNSEPLVKAAIPANTVPAPKGTCPKCGKHIGRGVAFHLKACNG